MSVKVAGVSLKVTGAEQFKSDLDKANTALKTNKQQMQLLNATYGKNDTSAEYLSQKQQLLSQQADAAKQRVESLKAAREAYAQSNDATAEGLSKLDSAILTAQTQEADFERQLNETTSALEQQGNSGKNIGEILGDVGSKATKLGDSISSMTAPLANEGKKAIENAMALEDSLYNLATMPGVEVSDLESYRQELIASSNATSVSATELSEAAYQAVSAGQDASQAVEFATLAAKTAKVGMTDTSTVVNGATSILNAWGDAAGGAEHVMDLMITAQNLGKTTVGDIASNIGQLTGLAPQLGVSVEETMASVAALTKNGVQTSTAINGLKAVMSNVIKPTTEAANVAKELGLDFSAAALQSKGFSAFLTDVMEKTGGDTELLAKLFGSVEGLNQVMLLGGAAAQDYSDILGEMGSTTGVVDDAFETRMSSSSQKVALATNKISNAGTDLVASLTPAISTVADLVSSVADSFDNLDEGAQNAILTVLGITASIGPVISTFGKLTTTMSTLLPMLISPAGLAGMGVTALAALGVYIASLPSDLETAMAQVQSTLDGITLDINTGDTNAIVEYFNDGAEAAQAFVDIVTAQDAETESGQSLLDSLFADGNFSRKDYSQMTTWVNTYVVPDINSAKQQVKKARQEFYKSLNGATNEDGSLMTTEQKNAAADAAVAPMQAIVDQMDSAKAELDTLMKQIYQNGGTATEEELARLQELLDLLGVYQQEIDAMSDQAVGNAQGSYNNVTSGYYTDSDLGTALGWVEGKKTSTDTALDQQIAELETATSEALAAAQTEEEKAAILDAQATQLAAIEAKRQEAENQRIEEYNAIFEGVAKANPADAATLAEMQANLEQLNTLQHLMYQLESEEGIDADTKSTLLGDEGFLSAMDAVLKQAGYDMSASDVISGDYGMIMAEAFTAMMQNAADNISENASDLDGSPILTALSAMLQNTDISTLDMSQLDGTLAAAMAVNLGQSSSWNMAGDTMVQSLFGGLTGSLENGWPESAQSALDSSAETAGSSAGGQLTTGFVNQMTENMPAVLAGAQAIHDAVQEVIGSGYTISVPGFNWPGASGGYYGGNVPTGNNNSVNVNINNANMMSTSSIKAFASELNGMQRAQQAGKGLMGN